MSRSAEAAPTGALGEPSAETLRAGVRAWLAEHWRPGIDKHDFLADVVDAGYAVPRWPADCYGRGLPGRLADVIEEEFSAVGAPGAGQDVTSLWGGTLVAHAPRELRDRLLRDVLSSRVQMCLLYSEPGAGSDLAGLQTRAEQDGDGWIVTGQKVWTSNAQRADYGFLLARTNWDVPKHQGISFFVLPMHQPGIETRPLRQITGETHFNEVFIDGARVPAGHLLGALGGGWQVLQTALAYERVHMGARARRPNVVGGVQAGQSTTRVGEDVDLVAIAREAGRTAEPLVRQQLARIVTLQRLHRWNAQRGKDDATAGRRSPLPMLAKLALSRFLHQRAYVHRHLLGAEAMLTGDDSPAAATANFLSLNAYFTSIGGGTDEIQRNIIGERVLGLPREAEVDRDVAFRDVLKAASRAQR